MVQKFDVIIIGAGSVGVPTALSLTKKGYKVAVVDELASVGQGQNKKAIGGIRATHTTPAKISLCLRSIEIFSNWEKNHGHDIEWHEGGYTFVVYEKEDETVLKDNLVIQKKAGLNIDWVTKEKIVELIPGINTAGLRGGTYSPEDGNASPLKAIHAFYDVSNAKGAKYFFNEKVTEILTKNNQITGVRTTKDTYEGSYVINAAGANAREIGNMVNLDLPVYPDSHEAGISEPVKKFIHPLVVDLRSMPGSKNFYFYQNKNGKFIVCLTPEPLIPGKNENETSVFLPQVARRLVKLIPKTLNLKMRRVWRGLYPMTPDGSPIIGKVDGIQGYINAVGMCGQGFMLGPGLGELLARLVAGELTTKDKEILNELSFYRNFDIVEKLK